MILRCLAIGLSCFALAAPLPSQQDNVLIIVADDVGVDSVRVYHEGRQPPPTPHIDALAARGVLFRNTWSNPLCSPTRACIQTGRYGLRTGIGAVVNWTGPSPSLSFAETTLPELLDARQSGYAHAAIGKWHLTNQAAGGVLAPNLSGWSHYSGPVIPTSNYFSWQRTVNGVTANSTTYMTTQNVDDALAWIQSAPRPWVCYLAFLSAHKPFHAPPPALHTQNLSSGQDPVRLYKAMVEAMDTEIGRLLTTLGPEVVASTNVIFLGDNGTPKEVSEPPFLSTHAKATMYEGGLNVPLIVAGPAVGSGGREDPALVSTVDLFATVAELCGVDAGVPWVAIDSVSFVPHLRTPDHPAVRSIAYSEVFLTSRWSGDSAVRDSTYKLIRRRSARPVLHEFYDLAADTFEQNELLSSRPLTPVEQTAMAALLAEINSIQNLSPSITAFGAPSCVGSNGRPAIGWTGAPYAGDTYTLTLQHGAAHELAVLHLGASNSRWGGVSLPYPLSSIGGGPGCFVHVSAEGLASTITDGHGSASISITLPVLSAIVGTSLFHAWLVRDPGAPNNPLGITSSDGARAVIGLRPL